MAPENIRPHPCHVVVIRVTQPTFLVLQPRIRSVSRMLLAYTFFRSTDQIRELHWLCSLQILQQMLVSFERSIARVSAQLQQ